MTTKTTNILYWIITILFCAFMLFSAIPDIMRIPEATKFIGDLGYPEYFTPFIGWAKVFGVIAVLIPGNFPKIKEWAYAGLFFDLFGATYSQIAKYGVQAQLAFMLLPFILLFASYYFYHLRSKNKFRTTTAA